MSNEKYAEGRDEIADFIKSSQNMLAKLDFLLQYGVWRLNFGMYHWKNIDKKPSFDPAVKPPPYPYGEKNFYVNASNNLWRSQCGHTITRFNEIYYSILLEKIKDFKKNNDNFDFNKGIVYANLGVAQSAQMKLDEGFANILKAFIEDYPYSDTNPESSIWRNPLFAQFERQYVRIPLQAMISQLNITGIASVDTLIEGFLDSLSNDQRAFFEYTFIRIMHSLEIWNEKKNGFTANRLLAYTQDLCLFNEDFLKSKFSNPDPHWLLDDLIREAEFSANLSGCGATSMTDLDSKLLQELSNSNQPSKCLRILLTIRNYSSHNIGGGTNTNCFYASYNEIFKELLRAMCQFMLLPKPISCPTL
jgi:hypothetical protein